MPDPFDGLSPDDRAIAALVAEGRTNQEIAGELHIAHQTVRNRMTHIFDVCGVNNRTQLAVLWLGLAD